MKEFILAALPWLFLAASLVLIVCNMMLDARKYDETGDTTAWKYVGKGQVSKMNQAMIAGMIVGILLSTFLEFGLGLGVTAGLFGGALIYVLVKYKSMNK